MSLSMKPNSTVNLIKPCAFPSAVIIWKEYPKVKGHFSLLSVRQCILSRSFFSLPPAPVSSAAVVNPAAPIRLFHWLTCVGNGDLVRLLSCIARGDHFASHFCSAFCFCCTSGPFPLHGSNRRLDFSPAGPSNRSNSVSSLDLEGESVSELGAGPSGSNGVEALQLLEHEQGWSSSQRQPQDTDAQA